MKITSAKFFSTRELVVKLRDVRMLKNPEAQPYKTCNIQVSAMETQFLNPAQRYVLSYELGKLMDLRWAMLEEYRIDILRLADTRIDRNGQIQGGAYEQLGYIEFTCDSAEGMITILPPVIEVSEESDKSRAKIINDGMHRCFLARQYHIIPAVVLIEAVPQEYPYYAYHLPGGWGDVQIVDKLGRNFIKKFHRQKNYHALYRDFNSVFINVGGPRGRNVPSVQEKEAANVNPA